MMKFFFLKKHNTDADTCIHTHTPYRYEHLLEVEPANFETDGAITGALQSTGIISR